MDKTAFSRVLPFDFRIKAAELGSLPDDEEEPPVPPGLKSLSPALESLCTVFQIDTFLLHAAAKTSADLNTKLNVVWQEAISKLSRQECNDYLARVARGDSQVRLELLTRLQPGLGTPLREAPAPRTIQKLYAQAADLREGEQRDRAAQEEFKRIQALEVLSQRQEVAWHEVETLMEKYKYRDATEVLVRLHQVALHKGSEAAFRTRLDQLMGRFKTRRTWIERIRNAGLDERT